MTPTPIFYQRFQFSFVIGLSKLCLSLSHLSLNFTKLCFKFDSIFYHLCHSFVIALPEFVSVYQLNISAHNLNSQSQLEISAGNLSFLSTNALFVCSEPQICVSALCLSSVKSIGLIYQHSVSPHQVDSKKRGNSDNTENVNKRQASAQEKPSISLLSRQWEILL